MPARPANTGPARFDAIGFTVASTAAVPFGVLATSGSLEPVAAGSLGQGIMGIERFLRAKRVLITGGSSGIGLELAKIAAAAGAEVAIAARDPARLESAREEIRRHGATGLRVFVVPLDVASNESVETGIGQGIADLGGIDLLINNAGFALPGTTRQASLRDYRAMLDVNYMGAVHVIRAALPAFLAQRSGCILNVASMLGFMGMFGYGAYAASKFALVGFTECLRAELAPLGIQVSLVYAPTTRTPGLERENLTKPPETWALESGSRQFSPQAVARAILSGAAAGKAEILVGADSALIWRLRRWAPGLLRWWLDRQLAGLRPHQKSEQA